MDVRSIAGWGCAGVALLAAGAMVWGDRETRSGGWMVVADSLGRADWLGVVLLLAALVAGLLLGSRAVRQLARAGLVPAAALSVLLGTVVLLMGEDPVSYPERKVRTAAPGRADRVLTVIHHGTNTTETRAQVRDVQVETGSGWSGRRWTLLTVVGEFEGGGALTAADWNGPDRVTVATDLEARVYDFSTGRPVPVPA
ncbi:hypothetical protein [Kitasatospora sp. NPDC090308]|uniref:hypothetical protein n=1 Tax=Kitasatospora sp. NPDC090308 TaxID=3364082 RepID=UPI0037FDE0ED